MDILPCGEIESTSSLASQLLREGRQAPFAVWAQSQSAGRGRRGQGWVSPVGNLYLTIVLPRESLSTDEATRGIYGCLPLKAAVLVAQTLTRRIGLRPTLKWPNDLLLEGRKVGGLLLEMSSAGGQPAETMIGIGLNLNVAPPFEGTYAATSLKDVSGEFQDVEGWVRSLVEAFTQDWGSLNLADVPEAFSPFALAPGSIWRDGRDLTLWQSEDVASDGSLPLKPVTVKSGEASKLSPRRLTSVDHGCSWIYLGEQHVPLLVADVGNSCIKLAAYKCARDPSPVTMASVPVEEESIQLRGAVDGLAQAAGCPKWWPIHLLSVNGVGASHLARVCSEASLTPLTITKKTIRRWGDRYDLQALGMDRLAAIEGYLATRAQKHRQNGGRFSVIVSTGTATTVDLVEVSGQHLGGLIFPGFKTALRSLRQGTHLLPLLDPKPMDKSELGDSTASAMQLGVLHMTLGAIERVLAMAHSEGGQSPVDVVLTGGQAELLSPHLESTTIPDLILDGARQLVLGGA
jgi:biotin-[acetyl-CoA-carboxylase] ligase BirA-like protein